MGLLSWLTGQEKNTKTEFSVDENEKLDGLSLNDIIKSHMQWKERLTDYLDGRSSEALEGAAIRKDSECVLGKWIYQEGKAQYGNTPEWHNLHKTHASFHSCAGCVVDDHNHGHDDAAKERLAGEFATLSSQIRMDLALLYRMTTKK